MTTRRPTGKLDAPAPHDPIIPSLGKAYQRISSHIAAEIKAGRLAGGERLPNEKDLAEHYGVSRATAREALIALEVVGMVQARHGAGVFVANELPAHGVSTDLDCGPIEINEARLLFEVETTALAARRADPVALRDLEDQIRLMKTQDDDVAIAADRAFHLGLARMSGNRALCAVIEDLWEMRGTSRLYRHMLHRAQENGATPQQDEHQAIFDAVAAGDVDRARHAMRWHLSRAIETLLACLELDTEPEKLP